MALRFPLRDRYVHRVGTFAGSYFEYTTAPVGSYASGYPVTHGDL